MVRDGDGRHLTIAGFRLNQRDFAAGWHWERGFLWFQERGR